MPKGETRDQKIGYSMNSSERGYMKGTQWAVRPRVRRRRTMSTALLRAGAGRADLSPGLGPLLDDEPLHGPQGHEGERQRRERLMGHGAGIGVA